MGRGGAETWADQWGTAITTKKKQQRKSGKRVGEIKKVASVGFVKAKAAAIVGAKKVKLGTSIGVKWIKEQYKKRKPSKE